MFPRLSHFAKYRYLPAPAVNYRVPSTSPSLSPMFVDAYLEGHHPHKTAADISLLLHHRPTLRLALILIATSLRVAGSSLRRFSSSRRTSRSRDHDAATDFAPRIGALPVEPRVTSPWR